MVQAVHLPREELQRRFGLSSRLTARIGALMAKRLGFSEAVLELASSEPDMENILLSPGILEYAETLNTSELKRLAHGAGLDDFLRRNQLCILNQQDLRILALRDEVEAEAVWEEHPSASGAVAVPFHEGDLSEAAAGDDLVPDEEVDALKLSILTSAEPKAKIEAIRKLSYSKMSADEKGRLLVSVLADDSTEVRVEATRALGALGLDAGMVQNIRKLFQGEAGEKRIAARALGRFASQGKFLERAVTLVVVSKALGEESFRSARAELIEAIRGLSDVVVADERFVADATGQLVAVLADSDIFERKAAREVLSELAQASPQKAGSVLWQRLTDIDEPKVRAALLSAVAASMPPDVSADELARLVVVESLKFRELDPECWQLRVLATRLGEASVNPAVQMISLTPPDTRLPIFRLIDMLCRQDELSERALRTMGEAVVDLLATGSDADRVSLLGLACLTEERFPTQVRQRIARELLRGLDSALMERSLEQIDEALVSLGPAALGPIVDYSKRRGEAPGRLRALRALGEIVASMSSATDREEKLVEEVAAFCLRLIKSGVASGTPMIVLGQLCSRGFVKPRSVQSADELLRSSLRHSEFPFQAADGLGWLASNPMVSLQVRVDIANSLLALFESKLPEELLHERQTEDGTVLDIGPEAKAYNEMLPASIEGLQRICVAAGADSVLRKRIIDSFLEKWKRIHEWEEVWGPANVATLADALGEIASERSLPTQDRVRIARALSEGLGRLSVVRALAKLFLLDGDSVELGSAARKVAETLLRRRLVERGLAPEEREAILKTLGVIASRPVLGRRSNSIARLRARVVSALEDALREHLSVAHEWLYELQRCEALSEFQRREIARRLSRFEQVVPR